MLEVARKRPVITHGRDHLTELIVTDIHESNQHIGPSSHLGLLSIRCRVVGAKHIVMKVTKGCVVCKKVYARTISQVGQLPQLD